MATSNVLTTVGILSSNPKFNENEKGGYWTFSVPQNHKDDMTTWYNFVFSGSADHPVLSRCKQGSSVVVVSKPSYTLKETTFVSLGVDPKSKKKSASCQWEAFNVFFGSYEKKEAKTEEESTDDFSAPKEDKHIPQDSVETEGFRPPF